MGTRQAVASSCAPSRTGEDRPAGAGGLEVSVLLPIRPSPKEGRTVEAIAGTRGWGPSSAPLPPASGAEGTELVPFGRSADAASGRRGLRRVRAAGPTSPGGPFPAGMKRTTDAGRRGSSDGKVARPDRSVGGSAVPPSNNQLCLPRDSDRAPSTTRGRSARPDLRRRWSGRGSCPHAEGAAGLLEIASPKTGRPVHAKESGMRGTEPSSERRSTVGVRLGGLRRAVVDPDSRARPWSFARRAATFRERRARGAVAHCHTGSPGPLARGERTFPVAVGAEAFVRTLTRRGRRSHGRGRSRRISRRRRSRM